MKLYVYTQVRENYGAHDWDGEGVVPEYWKSKGGDVYLIAVLTAQQAADFEAGLRGLVDASRERIDQRDEYFQEYIIDWALLEDDDKSACEEWETVKHLLPEETK